MKAIGNRLIIQPDPVKTTTETGMEIPAGSQEKPATGIVISKGKEVQEAEPGDRILYNMFGAGSAEIDREKVFFIRESDIILIIKSNTSNT